MTQDANTIKLRALLSVGGEPFGVRLDSARSLWRLSLEYKFYLASAVALMVLLSFAVLTSDIVASVKRHADTADYAHAVLAQLSVLTADFLHVEHLEHDLISGQMLTHRTAYVAVNRKAATDIAVLRRLIALDSPQQPRLRRMAEIVETQYASLRRFNKECLAAPPQAVASDWVFALDAVQELVDAMGQVENLAVKRSRAAEQASFQRLRNWSTTIGIAAGLLSAWLLALVRRTVSEKVAQRTAKLTADNEALRELSARIESAREDEQLRIAREMHDELGSTLTALRIELMGNVNHRRDSPGVPTQRRKSVDLVDAALQTVKEVVSELRPSVLDKFGIWEALKWKAQQFENWAKIPCELKMTPDLPLPSSEIATCVFRVVEESLTNVARHAKAKRVDVAVEASNNTLEITISDDGCGITKEKILAPDAFGLLSMQERARQLGGDFQVAGEAGRGTTARLRVPLPPDNGYYQT